jgi:hypothetical protein
MRILSLLFLILLIIVLLVLLLPSNEPDTEVVVPTLRPTVAVTSTPTQTITPSATATLTVSPTVTFTTSPTPTASPTSIPSATLIPGTATPQLPILPASVIVNVPPSAITRHYGKYSELQDGGHLMVGFPGADGVAAFYIDMYEVTNAQMSAYLNASTLLEMPLVGWESNQWISSPQLARQPDGQWVAVEAEQANWPIIEVSALAARAYCANRNARLPTLDEWRMAALWSESGRQKYPWGAVVPSDNLLRMNAESAVSVGQYIDGRSWIGAFDMAGNVAEWVQVDETTFGYIGGSFQDTSMTLNVQEVEIVDASRTLPMVGFRCVK